LHWPASGSPKPAVFCSGPTDASDFSSKGIAILVRIHRNWRWEFFSSLKKLNKNNTLIGGFVFQKLCLT